MERDKFGIVDFIWSIWFLCICNLYTCTTKEKQTTIYNCVGYRGMNGWNLTKPAEKRPPNTLTIKTICTPLAHNASHLGHELFTLVQQFRHLLQVLYQASAKAD